MKKTMVILAGVVLVLVVIALTPSRSDRPREGTSVDSEDSHGTSGYVTGTSAKGSGSGSGTTGPRPVRADANDMLPLTTEQFRKLSKEQQDAALTEYVSAFWATKTGSSRQEIENGYVPLEVFARPYMVTITEHDLEKLSPEDRRKAVDEACVGLAEQRTRSWKIVDRADQCLVNGRYVEAEAYLISVLETGRELNANKEALIITRLTGIAHQKVALNKMISLYTKTGQSSRLNMAQEELRSLEAEAEEIKRVAASREQ